MLGDGGLLSLCRVAMDTKLEEQDQLAHTDAHTEMRSHVSLTDTTSE